MVRILLLEDDSLFNETLQDFLEEEGFFLDTALDPYSALELTYEKMIKKIKQQESKELDEIALMTYTRKDNL